MRKYTLQWTSIAFLILTVFSCRKSDIPNIPVDQIDTLVRYSDTVLLANAGADQFTWLPTVTLDASQSRCLPYDSMRFKWKLISGPSIPEIVDSLAVKTLVKGLVFGTYRFELTVTVSSGQYAKDMIEVGVMTFPPNNNSCIIPGSTNMANFTGGRADMDAIAFKNKFYYVSGNYVDIYDPVTNTITNSALSLNRSHMVLTFNGDKLFIAGGFNYGSGPPSTYKTESRVDILDASTNVWSTAELSKARYRIGASSIGDKVFFAGGMTDVYNPTTRLDIYDMKTKTWSYRELEVAGIYIPAIVGNILWLMTGNHVEKYDPVENKWTSENLGINLPQFSTDAIELDNKIYITGATEVPVYDMETKTWTAFTLKENVFLVPAIACNNKLVFVGGMTSWFVYSTTMEIYDPVTRSINLYKLEADLYYESLLTYDNYIYSAGGMIYEENSTLSGICRFRPN